ncbi:MAG: UbiD family decarboxylase [Chloroflexi bacterium]|nr:UbiD family decarboxylase [Chloroflexota bacterium]
MGWLDFRDFVDGCEKKGDVLRVEGADPYLELGTLVELMCEQQGPMLLFDDIKGFPRGYRIAAKPYSTTDRTAFALNLPVGRSKAETNGAWRERMKDYEPVTPIVVRDGPILENVQEGDGIDLHEFPIPKWHELDGGQYLGTGCSIVTRDPEEDWCNVGTYRVMLHDRNTCGISITPYHHGNVQMRKWWLRGKSCPIAIVISPDPYLFIASTHGVPWGESELAWAGYFRGAPEEIIIGQHTQLPLPARAEIVIEGEVPPLTDESKLEGPFGEYTGYYAAGEKMRPVIHVKAVYYRSDPMMHGDPPVLPSAEGSSPVGNAIWEMFEKAGVPGVKDIQSLSVGGAFITAISMRQSYAGHAAQVAQTACGLIHNMCRFIIVVDDDVDVTNTNQVLWAMATRCDPAHAIQIMTGCPSTTLDPAISPDRKAKGDLTAGRALILATRPWEWFDQFPQVNRATDELRADVREKWAHLFDKSRRGELVGAR